MEDDGFRRSTSRNANSNKKGSDFQAVINALSCLTLFDKSLLENVAFFLLIFEQFS